MRCPIQTSHSSRSMPCRPAWSRRGGGGCVTRRCARTAAASTGRRISAATPAIAWCSRRSERSCRASAVWYASNLKRTHQTADAIWSAGFPRPGKLQHEPALAEQHLGEWQGLNRAAFFASRPIEVGSYWFAPIDEPAPGGESFMDLYNRVRGAIERINAEPCGQGRDCGRAWRNDQGRDWTCARRSAGAGARLHYRQLLGDAARSPRQRRSSAAGGCRWSTSSRGSPTPRTMPCISPRDLKSQPPASWHEARPVVRDARTLLNLLK